MCGGGWFWRGQGSEVEFVEGVGDVMDLSFPPASTDHPTVTGEKGRGRGGGGGGGRGGGGGGGGVCVGRAGVA